MNPLNPFENAQSVNKGAPQSAKKFSLQEYFKDGYILLVDDNSSLRKTIKNMARQFEVSNVIEVEDGDTALRVLRTNDKQCLFVLLDWIMPRMSGLDVVREIRADNEIADLPILMVTAEADPAQIIRAGEEGINGYLTKPFVGKAIESKICAILEARMNPPEHVKLLIAGETQAKNGNLDKAMALFHESLMVKETARVMVLIGDIHHVREEIDKALRMYSGAISNNPRFLKAYTKAAKLYEKSGNMDSALDLLNKAAEISPNSPERYMAIGRLHLIKEREAEALEAFHKAVKVEPRVGGDIAEELLVHDKPKIAEMFFRKNLATTGGKSAYLHNRIGIALRRQGKWREAIFEYEAAIKLDPGDETIYYNLGKAHIEGKNNGMASKYFNMALKLKPDSKEIKEALESLGKQDRAYDW